MGKVRKPKVVFIHPDLGIGGAERLILDVAVALSKKNEVSFVTNHFNKNHSFEELRDNQYPVSVIGDWIPRGVYGIFQALFSYVRMIYLAIYYVLFLYKDEKPDLFFIDQIPMAVPFIKWAGGKVVYYCHHPDLLASSPGGFLKRLYRLPINWLELKGTAMADTILVNSKYTAKVFKSTFPEITGDIQIVYPTISSTYQNMIVNIQQHKEISEIAHIPKDAFIFLSINRFHPAKRLELALDALEAAQSSLSPNEWSKSYLIIAGGYDPHSSINASYFAKLVKVCEEKNLMMKVTFLKSPSDSLKADLLMRCDCLIYTPINEHFGIVPLEAMTAGKPVIACNSGGPCETVLDDITGYLCNPDGDSLANAMSKIVKPDRAARMGLMGRERLQQYFSYKNFERQINEIIDINISEEETSDDDSSNSADNENVEHNNSVSSNHSHKSELLNHSGVASSEMKLKTTVQSSDLRDHEPNTTAASHSTPKSESLHHGDVGSPDLGECELQEVEHIKTASSNSSPKLDAASQNSRNLSELEENQSNESNTQAGQLDDNSKQNINSPELNRDGQENVSLKANSMDGRNIEIILSPSSTTSTMGDSSFDELVNGSPTSN